MHPLIADGGEMTVLRDLAAFSYGRWSVDWPESVPEDQRPELPDGRDFGYASKLKKDPGRFGRRFVRADVTIKAQDFDEAGKPIPFSGESDVEETLDDAAKRTDGDVFFEREITRAGLGALVPRVDFDVDSVVPVLIWGKTIPAPVTSIEDVVEQGAVVDYRVHVGGQLLQDDAARERANREVERTIAQERRERVKAVSKERKARTAAISAESRRSDAYADSVASDVESRLSRDFAASYERYSKALTQLGDTWRQELQKGLSAEQRARVEALRQEQQAREKAGTDLRGQLEKTLGDAVAGEARARQAAIANLSKSFTTDLQAYGELVKEAKNYVDPATAQVVEFWSKENQNNFNKAVQLTLSAQAAYNDVNDIKWVSQDAWNAQQQKINEARAKFEEQQRTINNQQRLLDDAQSKQLELTKALTAANARAINLMNMQNHGSLYMTDTFVIKSGEQCNFSWSGRRGDMVGCHTGSVSDGGTYIKFDSPGDWQIYARVHFPPGSTSGTTTILRINFNDGHGNWSGATCTMYNKGWDQTHSCLMTVNVDNPNAYCYISGFASTTSGALGWTAPTGDQTTEFSVRQLSVKGLF